MTIIIAIAVTLLAAYGLVRLAIAAYGLGRRTAPWREALRHMEETGPIGQQPAPFEDELGDDTVSLFCRHCNGEPLYRCTCTGDCGAPDCDWEFERDLAAMLGRESGPA